MNNCCEKTKLSSANLKKVILVGNPNVGKSLIFSHLTGKYVTVSNYPGTTVEVSRGVGEIYGVKVEIIDTPGINSITPFSEDEKVSYDILVQEKPDLVVQVADAKNLARTLILTLQLKEMGFPVILNLNMMDEAQQRRIDIDVKKLKELIGIDIVSTVATNATGIRQLRNIIKEKLNSSASYQIKQIEFNLFKLKALHGEAGKICAVVVTKMPRQIYFLERVSYFSMHPITGFPILIFVLWLMYQFVGVYAAQHGVEFMEEVVFGKFINPNVIKLMEAFIPYQIIREFLVGEYGIITMAITYAIAIILPILTAFFLFFSVLEDSGYLPRLSVLLNKLFRVIGLSGKAVIPMILGLGCVTMATMTTRTLETRKERMLATLLLALAVPCSAQLGVVLGMIGGISALATLTWIMVLILVFLIVGYLGKKIIPGKASDFVMEIPPIRIPKFGNIAKKTFSRIIWYLSEAVPLFIYGTALLFIFDKIHILTWIEKLASPIVVNFMGLPQKATQAFLLGFFRRDYGAAGLFSLARDGMLSPNQVLVSLVTITLFVPCVAQFLVMIKERGPKVAVAIMFFVFSMAILIGGFLNLTLKYFGINI